MRIIDKDSPLFKGLRRIFLDRFNTDICSFSPEMADKHLLGKEIGFAPRDLLYLFYDIEREFGIRIFEEDIAAGRFDTVSNIIGIIEKELYSGKDESHIREGDKACAE